MEIFTLTFAELFFRNALLCVNEEWCFFFFSFMAIIDFRDVTSPCPPLLSPSFNGAQIKGVDTKKLQTHPLCPLLPGVRGRRTEEEEEWVTW